MGAVQIKRMVYPDKTLHLKSLSTGYSLPELLLVIAILAILVSIAVTGVASMGNDQRVNQTAYQLFHDLSHSRSSALTRGRKCSTRRARTARYRRTTCWNYRRSNACHRAR